MDKWEVKFFTFSHLLNEIYWIVDIFVQNKAPWSSFSIPNLNCYFFSRRYYSDVNYGSLESLSAANSTIDFKTNNNNNNT